ncbi:hypothetical protein B0T14DRAFT_529483 [Immersiella caudata]|uniref:Uncharacterized protein n=1 Tax=Immersiella caudata TaxID=314043 RepID=A0AA39W4A4_9PEZI|nr:hypothetical protein B0T14DRAFT_529483 [Immersiella caudata]
MAMAAADGVSDRSEVGAKTEKIIRSAPGAPSKLSDPRKSGASPPRHPLSHPVSRHFNPPLAGATEPSPR